MAYFDSSAAYAYDDMQAAPLVRPQRQAEPNSAPSARPRFDVYTGEGREANQLVSPVFTHVVKVFCVLAALFCAIGVARVAIAGVTTSMLNDNAQLTSSLEAAQDESSTLEVMNSVYGSDSRIRDLATGTLGMVEAEDTVTLDLSASTEDASEGASTDSTDTTSASDAGDAS